MLSETNDRRDVDTIMTFIIMGPHADIGETIADFDCGWAVDLDRIEREQDERLTRLETALGGHRAGGDRMSPHSRASSTNSTR